MNHDREHEALYERWLAAETGEDRAAFERIASTCSTCAARLSELAVLETRLASAQRMRGAVLQEAARVRNPPLEAVVRDTLRSSLELPRERSRIRNLRTWVLAVAALVVLAFGVHWFLEGRHETVLLGTHDLQLVAPQSGAPFTGTFQWSRGPADGEEFELRVERFDESTGTWSELRSRRVRSTEWTASEAELAAWRGQRLRWRVDVYSGLSLVFPTEPVELAR